MPILKSKSILETALLTLAATAAIAAILLAASANYGGDNDTYGILSTFLMALRNGQYVPSRFTGYPVAEIGIGFFAWLGGSALSNVITYLLFLLSVIIFPFCLKARLGAKRYLLFLCLALTSPVLVFDNIQSIDYSWALFFWVSGCLALRKFLNRTASAVLMSLSIGSRPAFAVFVIAAIIISELDSEDISTRFPKSLLPGLTTLFGSLYIGSLYYLPVWINHSFGFSWINAAAPDQQGLVGLLSRFLYKVIYAIGPIQFIAIASVAAFACFGLIKDKKTCRLIIAESSKVEESDAKLLCAIMLSNLLIFFRLPLELSYLQPFLICMYMVLVLALSRNKLFFPVILFCIFLNISNWFIQPKLLAITYKSRDMCGGVVAQDARLGLGLEPGRITSFIKGQSRSACYDNMFNDISGIDYSKIVADGLPLRTIP